MSKRTVTGLLILWLFTGIANLCMEDISRFDYLLIFICLILSYASKLLEDV